MNPFEVLGLPVRADLSDAQVRTAWKDIAAKTHPDRPGGGDIAAYTAAATAYAQLRTPWGRSEAYADLAVDQPYVPVPDSPVSRPSGADLGQSLLLVPARICHGRPLRLAARALAAAGLSLLVLALIPGQASGPAVVTGLAIWFCFSARADLAPPPGR
ncbi:MAG TPA: J domain-containing protein [Streptosporangiaceae bacterium]